MKTVVLSVLSMLLTLHAPAAEVKLDASVSHSPFQSCEGRGDSPISHYANQKVQVLFHSDSIEIVTNDGKKEAYMSGSKFCGVDLSGRDVLCVGQRESSDTDRYVYKKACRVPDGDRDLYYRLNVDVALNLQTVNGVQTATGFLNCSANEDGSRSLALSKCK